MSEKQSIIQQLYTSTVKDLLEPLDLEDCFIEKSADIEHIFQQLRKKKHLWVVDSQKTKHLLGIITESDTIKLFAPACDPVQSFDIPTLQSFQFGLSLTALDVMSEQPITAEPEETIADVITKMKQHKIKQLAILDNEKHILGEITLNHLIKEYLHKLLSNSSMETEMVSEKNVLETF